MNSRFDFYETPITDLYRVDRKPICDSRGFLCRFFCAEEFRKIGFTHTISQINQTLTKKKGAVRGLHFQYPPNTEVKIVTCIKGKVFDVAVDVRRNSPTFLRWYGVELSEENSSSLYIPEGFAHGFQTLTEDCELIYLHSTPYRPDSEGALNVLDSRLSIDWPLKITEMSERDRSHSLIVEFKGVEMK